MGVGVRLLTEETHSGTSGANAAVSESPQEFHFLSMNSNVPAVATSFKPAMKVLSRKPAPQMIVKKDPVTGIEQMTIADDDAPEEVKSEETPEERKLRQQKELEEKQRRYDEARAKIFGEPKSGPPSQQSSSGSVTPPQTSEGRQNYRSRGRGRGGARGDNHGRHDSPGKRAATQQSNTRELFDPNYSSKPGFNLQKRGEGGSPQPGRSTTPRAEDQIVRAPREPDGSGRGGFGFANRGSRDG